MIKDPQRAGRKLFYVLFCILSILINQSRWAEAGGKENPPKLPREFRGVWVATVDNIDWPSKRGLPVDTQKAEILKILDTVQALHMNAVILQVRPCCDALYASDLEPWSEYLTGKMGQAPDPAYDPLETWVEEAHRRGLELHAWFNPYRAHHPSAKGPICSDHVSKTKPEITRSYGSMMWLDPGDPATRKYSLDVITDVMKRYDIDGVHIDDYFYPYKEKDKNGDTIPFPDDKTYAAYKKSGGSLSKDDWRRENVDTFVEALYKRIKEVKPQVRLGISPFGIWRPGNPETIKGFDAFSELYADSRKWLREGWIDYWTPQLYWSVNSVGQSYPKLLRWWCDQNLKGRNMWPGLYTSRLMESNWNAKEITDQISATREQDGAGGVVHFSMKAILNNSRGIADSLARSYSEPALVPYSPWLGGAAPGKPRAFLRKSSEGMAVSISVNDRQHIRQWAVQYKVGDKWSTQIMPITKASYAIRVPGKTLNEVYVTAINEIGMESAPLLVKETN